MKTTKKPRSGQLALKGGSYSLLITAIVLAILIVVNVFASTLPASLTSIDISSNKLYSITSNTKVVVNNLQQDVTIYWIVQAEQEDDILENLLSKYDSLSDHISVVKKNPDAFPTFTEQYTDEDVPNNSLIVESGERFRYISYNEIYLTEFDYYSYTSGFDGEGAITSAIDYVVTEDLPQLYVLEGHGESELPATFADSIEKENIELNTLSLLTVDAIPEEADAIMIYAPQSDISSEEKTMLADYVSGGGKLFVMAGPVEGTALDNLNALLADYGVEMVEGIVIEGNRSYYALGYPYILMPDMESSEITDSLIESNYYPILSLSQGLSIGYSSQGTVTELLTTSGDAFSKIAGFELDTYEKEEGDIDGPFTLAVSIESDGDGQLIWFSASDFLGDMYNAYSSGANVDLAMNSLSSLIGEREALAIRSKSLNYNYLTISETTASTLKTLMIGVFPLTYLAIGILIIVRKRGKQNETV
ncbi:MAG: GldG family protein [Lachnospiraceae bacterium]|nr:GldG family protein [Lachnospiraceae bacterium]